MTDSTSDIPEDIARDHDITVIPLLVSFGTESFRDSIDFTPDEFIDRLIASPALPTTSQPAVTDFEAVFRESIDRGQDVVCVTVSANLSGTFNAARLAAEAVDPERVRVVDGRATTMQLGWVAVAAARAAREGKGIDEVAAEAESATSRVKMYALLRTLDYVHKGGRIGKAQQLVGSALAIKPILSFVDGVLIPVERVRTWKKAVARLVDLATPTPTDIVVLHSRNLEDANRLVETLQKRYPDARLDVGYSGAVITTYAGPGALAIAALYPE